MVMTPEGHQILTGLGQAVNQKIVEIKVVDQQG
jgi:transketolase C-terminal domain/subunit